MNSKFSIDNINISTYNQAKTFILNLNKSFSFDTKINADTIIKNISDTSSPYYNDVISAIKAIFIKDRKTRYEFIYDLVCDDLDEKFHKQNYCKFENNVCTHLKNKKFNDDKGIGCCYSFKEFHFFTFAYVYAHKPCENLDCKICSIKCISCKLFTCSTLKKCGVKFNPNNILLLDCFFTKKQKLILKSNFFKKKEKIISKLLEKNLEPYFLYYLTYGYKI